MGGHEGGEVEDLLGPESGSAVKLRIMILEKGMTGGT